MTDKGGARNTLRTISTVGTLRTQTDFTFDFAARRDDFAAYDLDSLTRIRRESTASAPVLVARSPVGLVDQQPSLLGDNGAELLKDAWFNVGEGEYETALELLAEFTEIVPGNPEALYLETYCHHRLGGEGLIKALRLLRPPLPQSMEVDLRAKVRELRATLRAELLEAEIEIFKKAGPRATDVALERLRELMELVPEEGSFAYLLALALARRGDVVAALRTAQAGATTAEVNRDQVSVLAGALALHVVAPLAVPAVTAFKEGDYHRAGYELSLLDPEWRHTPVIEDFEDFLSLIRDHPPGRPLPPPTAPAGRVDNLYSLIAEAEVNDGCRLLTAGMAVEAERVLASALHHVPGFARLNFVYAASLYVQGRDPERAARSALIAVRDPSIKEAHSLLEAIREHRDALAINPLVEEFTTTMNSVKGTVSVEELSALDQRLRTVKDRLGKVAPLSSPGKRTVGELAAVLDRQLMQIADEFIRSDVVELVERFNRLVASIGPYTLHRVHGQLLAIQSEARRLSGHAKEPDDQRLLGELLQAVSRMVQR